jgi:hypothetical protein
MGKVPSMKTTPIQKAERVAFLLALIVLALDLLFWRRG